MKSLVEILKPIVGIGFPKAKKADILKILNLILKLEIMWLIIISIAYYFLFG